jgi:FkbM family methyltransferase
MSDRVVRGEGRSFRRTGRLERAAAQAGRCLGAGAARAALARALDAALWVRTAGRGVRAVLPHGEVVRLAPRYRRTFWNVEEYEAFRTATGPGDVVIDAGANTGAYTVLFAQWVGPQGRVFAFEPVPRIARALRAQVALNGLTGRVRVVEAALGESEGTLTMTAPGMVGINRRALSTDSTRHRLNVPSVSLDRFCQQRSLAPAVLKIDVEGAELDVLRGARQVLSAVPRPQLFVEFHPSLWHHYAIAPDDLRRELGQQHLRAEPLRRGDDVWRVEGICARVVAG